MIVEVTYETSPSATALQWLTPEQTAGKREPYLFSQCQVTARPCTTRCFCNLLASVVKPLASSYLLPEFLQQPTGSLSHKEFVGTTGSPSSPPSLSSSSDWLRRSCRSPDWLRRSCPAPIG